MYNPDKVHLNPFLSLTFAVRCSFSHLHIVFEDVGGSRHVHNVIDDEFAESGEQVPPLMKSFDLVGLVLLIAL